MLVVVRGDEVYLQPGTADDDDDVDTERHSDEEGEAFTQLSWCLQLLEILEISWNLKFLLEILEISWNFVDAPGKSS